MGGKGGKGASAPSMDMTAYTQSMNDMNAQMIEYQRDIDNLLSEDWKPDIPEIDIPEYTAPEEVDWGAIDDTLTEEQQSRYVEERDGTTNSSSTILTDSLLDDEDAETTSVLG